MDFWKTELRDAARVMIAEVEGKSCVNIGEYDGGVYVCRRLTELEIDEDCLNGMCE